MKKLVFQVVDYQLIAGHLYKMGTDSILRRCVLEHERPRILAESHEGIEGGHYVRNLLLRTMVADHSHRLKRVLPEM
jgi:hypothetical protein